MKSTKRMLQDCLIKSVNIDNNKFLIAIIQYHNTPHQDCWKSPAQMVFGRALRYYIPAMPYKYAPLADWCLSQELRERLLANFMEKDRDKLARHTKQLEELPVGTPVVIQNRYPTKWDNTGVILEN